MLMRCIGLLVSIIVIAGASQASGNTHNPELTDQALLDFVSKDFDRRMMFRNEIIGTHNSLPVLVTYPCSDLCPDYTVRIVRYDVPPDQCDRVGGRLDLENVPRGIATYEEAFCKPAVLVPGHEVQPATAPPVCLADFIVRLAGAADLVCAPPAARVRTRRENANAEKFRDPAGA